MLTQHYSFLTLQVKRQKYQLQEGEENHHSFRVAGPPKSPLDGVRLSYRYEVFFGVDISFNLLGGKVRVCQACREGRSFHMCGSIGDCSR